MTLVLIFKLEITREDIQNIDRNISIFRHQRFFLRLLLLFFFFFETSSKRSEWNAIEKRSPGTDERNEKQLLWNDRRNEISTSFTLVRLFEERSSSLYEARVTIPYRITIANRKERR